jgi:hypothetical protein
VSTNCILKNKKGEIIVEFDRPQPFGETEFRLSRYICTMMASGERRFKKLTKAEATCNHCSRAMRDILLYKRDGILAEFLGFMTAVQAMAAGEYGDLELTHDDELTRAALITKWSGLLKAVYKDYKDYEGYKAYKAA